MSVPRLTNARDVARAVAKGGDMDSPEGRLAVVAELRDSPNAENLLERLAADHDPVVRSFVTDVALAVLPQDPAVTILRGLAQDRDADVRNGALVELLSVDAGLLEPLLPSIRRQLHLTDDDPSVIFAIWTLARVGDSGATGELRALAADSPWPPVRRAAAIGLLILTDRGAEIADRLREHDHEWTTELAIGAGTLGTREALAALQLVAATSDDSCRQIAKWALSKYFAGAG
jgi:hypothetical protein